jgi:sulfopyruvate decarboxylase subunit alpha
MALTATTSARTSLADELGEELIAAGFGPFYGTPCGVLAPLLTALDARAGLLTVAREDNAVGMAAGAWLAGRHPVVLMQNSGLGQSVNALASLVVPNRIPVLLIVSLRGADPDPTQENIEMGRLTRPLLNGLGFETLGLDPGTAPAAAVSRLGAAIAAHRPAALLIPPTAFGWTP